MNVGEKIKLLRKENGFTQTELGERLGVKKNAVSKWECGRVEDIPASKIRAMADLFNVAPSYLIDDDAIFSRAFNTTKVPRLGVIACGEPILAEQNIEGYDEVPDYIKCDFTLVAKGDSMIKARIYDGDIVCIKQQPTVNNGQIAAVLIGEEATLKRVKFIDGGVVLLPENSDYDPMIFTGEAANDVHIIGLATHFISRVV